VAKREAKPGVGLTREDIESMLKELP
jgi:hypothetical protein